MTFLSAAVGLKIGGLGKWGFGGRGVGSAGLGLSEGLASEV